MTNDKTKLDLVQIRKDLLLILSAYLDAEFYHGEKDTKLQKDCKELIKSKSVNLLLKMAIEYNLNLEKYLI